MILSMVLEFDGCSEYWLLMILTTALPRGKLWKLESRKHSKNSSNSHQSVLGLGKHDDACVDQKHRPCRTPSASQAVCPWITRPLALQRHHTAEPATSLCPMSFVLHNPWVSHQLTLDTHILFFVYWPRIACGRSSHDIGQVSKGCVKQLMTCPLL